MGLMDTIKGWFGTAKEEGADIADETMDQASELVDEAEPYVDKTKDFAEDAVDTAGDQDRKSRGLGIGFSRQCPGRGSLEAGS